MRLDDWIAQRGITREAFAALIDVEAPTVTRYANGDRVPRPRIMRRIIEVTEGQVTANDFIGGKEPIPNVTDAAPTPAPAE